MNYYAEFTEPSPVQLRLDLFLLKATLGLQNKIPCYRSMPYHLGAWPNAAFIKHSSFLGIERVMRIELTSPAWEAGVIAIIRHPQWG